MLIREFFHAHGLHDLLKLSITMNYRNIILSCFNLNFHTIPVLKTRFNQPAEINDICFCDNIVKHVYSYKVCGEKIHVRVFQFQYFSIKVLGVQVLIRYRMVLSTWHWPIVLTVWFQTVKLNYYYDIAEAILIQSRKCI